MKQSPLPTVLLVVLTLSVLASLGLCWSYISSARELRTLQTQASFINNRRAAINSLANDCLEYSKTHPAIDPILESVGVKGSKGAAAAPAAATKPATK